MSEANWKNFSVQEVRTSKRLQVFQRGSILETKVNTFILFFKIL